MKTDKIVTDELPIENKSKLIEITLRGRVKNLTDNIHLKYGLLPNFIDDSEIDDGDYSNICVRYKGGPIKEDKNMNFSIHIRLQSYQLISLDSKPLLNIINEDTNIILNALPLQN